MFKISSIPLTFLTYSLEYGHLRLGTAGLKNVFFSSWLIRLKVLSNSFIIRFWIDITSLALYREDSCLNHKLHLNTLYTRRCHTHTHPVKDRLNGQEWSWNSKKKNSVFFSGPNWVGIFNSFFLSPCGTLLLRLLS